MKDYLTKGFELKWLNKNSKIILAIILIIAFIIRIYRIGYFSLWLDEFPYAFSIRDLLSGNKSLNELGDKFGLLIVFITLPFIKIFGESEFWLRIPTELFGTISIYLAYRLTKKTLGKKTAIITVLLFTLSLFCVFYSRIFRYYSTLQFFYLLLIIVIYELFENSPQKEGFWGKINVDKRIIYVFPIVFLLTILSGPQSVFAFFGLTSYFFIMSVVGIFQNEGKARYLNKYSIFALPLTIISLIFLIAPLQNIVKPILTIFLSDDYFNKVMPDWKFIKTIAPEKFWAAWKTYIDVFKFDYSIILFYITIPGIIITTIRNYKLGIIIFSFLVVPLLLMSFVFRTLYLPWYATFFYPLYLILSAVSLVFIFDLIYHFLAKNDINKNKAVARKRNIKGHTEKPNEFFHTFLFCLLIVSVLAFAPLKGIKSLLTNKDLGQVVRPELFKSSMVDWKKNMNIVKKIISKDDILLATWLPGVEYYLNRHDIIFFRQRRFDGTEKKYLPLEVDTIHPNASSYEGLMHLMKTTKTRINLISDYNYFYNALTDPRTRQLVELNFHYSFGLFHTGEFSLWTYDPKNPVKKRSFVYDLGKRFSPFKNNKSPEIEIALEKQHLQYKYAYIIVQAQGVDFGSEGAIQINNKLTVNLPKCKTSQIEDLEMKIETKNLVEGVNKVIFFYGPPQKLAYMDVTKGFVVYDLIMRFSN